MNWVLAVLFGVLGLFRIFQAATNQLPNAASGYLFGALFIAFAVRRVMMAMNGRSL